MRILLLTLLFFLEQALAVDLKETNSRGFLWYEESHTSVVPEAPPSKLTKQDAVTIAKSRNDARKKELDDAMTIALDRPTVANVIAAQRMQKKIMDHATTFSDVWSLAAVLDAEIARGQNNPNVLHQALARDQKAQQSVAQLKFISKEWGLFLYVKEGCIYCQKFAPIVSHLQKETGLQVLAISQRGENYGQFPGQKDTGLMSHLNPEGLAPVLFLVHKNGQYIQVVARGLTDLGTVQENILMVHKFLLKKINP